MRCVLLVRATTVAALMAAAATSQSNEAASSAAPSHPLVWHDTAGRDHAIKTRADWAPQRAAVLAGMQEVMGPLPDLKKLPPLDVRVNRKTQHEGYLELRLTYAAEDGDRVPAYLLLPTAAAGHRLPAVVVLHQTNRTGKDETVGYNPAKNMGYGQELARRGYVVLAPDYPSFGEYSKYDFAKDRYVSGTMKAIVNHLRGVDLLVARPEVDAERIGTIGHSLGGHNAIFLGVFDERIKVVVSSCGWVPMHEYYRGDLTGWTSDRYMPRIRDVYGKSADRLPWDFYGALAALAPRAFFSSSPLRDANFDVAGVRKAERVVRPVYELFGAADRFVVVHPDCQHDFPPEIREQAYQFIDRVLAHRPTMAIGAAHAGARIAANSPSGARVTKAAHTSHAAKPDDYGQKIKPVPPHEPAEAMGTFKVLDGFHLEQVAAEPLLASPVAIAFDEHQRAYVAEMRDYPEYRDEKLGRIRLLEDVDHDGHWDKSYVFAEGLPWPTAIACYKDGVIVGAAPDILYLKDTDGDHKADVKRVMFTGFNHMNVQGLLNSFTWGIDGRIHAATSGSGATVTAPGGPDMKLVLKGRDFAFDPATRRLEATSGGAQHGLTFDDYGNKFVCSNGDHIQAVMFEDRYVARSPYLAAPSPRASIASDGPAAEVYRISPVETWREIRTRLRMSGESPGVVEGGGRAAGYFTGATGVTIYRGNGCPELRGQAIVGDVGSNIVHRKQLTSTGIGWRADRVDKERELVASRDIWFRPVGFANAPDGSLYIMDMYREVIEHPDSLPPELKRHLDTSSGRERGRLYRLVGSNFRQPKYADLGKAGTAELVALLEHPNGWHRDTAGRLLVERGDPGAAGPLEHVVRHSKYATARVAALYQLNRIGRLDEALLLALLEDHEPHVREHAVRLSETAARTSPKIQARLCAMASDTNPRVRYQLAFSLGEFSGDARDEALASLFTHDGGDPWMNLAITSSWGRDPSAALARLAERPERLRSQAWLPLLESLARQVGTSGRPAQVQQAVLLAEGRSEHDLRSSMAIIRGLGRGLARTGRSPVAEMAAASGGRSQALLDKLIDRARDSAANSELDADLRADAVRLLRLAPLQGSRKLFEELLEPTESQTVQLAVVETLATFNEQLAADALIDAWSDLSPAVRREALEALFSRHAWLSAVLAAVDRHDIAERDIDPVRIVLLEKDADKELAVAARRIAQRMKLGRRKDVVDAYQAALTKTGDAARGRKLFEHTCAACHRLNNVGHDIGPNLLTMRNRGGEAILTAVLDPNREVNPQYVNYFLQTGSGQTITGLVAAESASSITLKRGDGIVQTVLRAEVEQMRSTGLSLMPEGLEKQFDQQGMADLLAYLMSPG